MTVTPVDLATDPAAGGVVMGSSVGNAPIRGRSPGQLAWRRLRRDKVAMASATVLAIYVLLALFGPLLLRALHITVDQQNSDLLDDFGAPIGRLGGITSAHPFGVEPQLGRDLLGQVLIGMRTSLTIAVIVTLVSTIIGVIAGVAAGFAGGWVDGAISRTMDLFLAFPTLLFLIAIIPVLQQKFAPDPRQPQKWVRITLLLVLLIVFGWAGLSRLMRGQTVVLRDREFIEAARAMGAGPGHIIFKQLLPNLWAPILISVSLSVPALVTTEAALSFLGVGILEPTPDLGRTLQASITYLGPDPMYFLFPGLTIVVLVLAFNLLGDSVRDALDPKSFR